MRWLKFRANQVAYACLWTLLLCASGLSHGQDVNAGRLVYTTPQVAGQNSCSAGACHTLDPARNQNRILKAADDPGAIGFAINSVLQMAFLKDRLTLTQLVDLAAYIGNPGGVTGAPVAQLTPESLSFANTVIGSSSIAQSLTLSNIGVGTLNVTGVGSDNAEFSVSTGCAAIPAGGSCDLSIVFTPAATGARSALITVTHNGTGGASSASVTGSGSAAIPSVPGIEVSPLSLEFGAITSGSFSGGLFVAITSVGTAPLTITGISEPGTNFPVIGGDCLLNVPMPVAARCSLLVRFIPNGIGLQSATLGISHNASSAPINVNVSGTGTAAPLPTRTMVEYVYTPLNYFFITSRDDDKALLDTVAGFQRTGQSFAVLAEAVTNSKGLTRFYFDQIALGGARGSHFYTLLDEDKFALRALNPDNAKLPRLPVDEGIDSWAYLPLVTGIGGTCASGLLPVFRLFRNGTKFPDDPNHRFTVNVNVYNAFVALGWDGEGVSFCVPTQ